MMRGSVSKENCGTRLVGCKTSMFFLTQLIKDEFINVKRFEV